jgi:hypothetical protein
VNKDGVSFFTNGVWHLATQPIVDSLRDRIQFHMTKILFITEPPKFGLLNDIASDIKIIRGNVEELYAVQILGISPYDLRLPQTPQSLNKRFQEALISNPPEVLSDGSNRTIEPTFEALHQHFLQSAWSCQGPVYGLQTIEQYLNPIKAQYLFEKLRNESALSWRYYYERSVTRIKQRIKAQFRRTDVTQYDTEELDGLDAKSFEIWTDRERSGLFGLRNRVESGVPDEELLELSLPPEAGVSHQYLEVFRQSDVVFRLVQRIVYTAANHPLRDIEYLINVRHCRYIPWYANPTNRTPSTMVQIRSTVSRSGRLYTLKDQDGLPPIPPSLASGLTHAWTLMEELLQM